MRKVIINENNYRNLKVVFTRLKRSRKRGLELFLNPFKALDLERLKQISEFLYSQEKFFQVKIKDMPYCLAPEAEDRLILNEPLKAKTHLRVCRRCRYKIRCGGILKSQLKFYKNLIKPVKDLPREVMIEIEPRCNFNCIFCFNKNSFAENGRDEVKSFSMAYAKKIIGAIALSGVKIVRFVGRR